MKEGVRKGMEFDESFERATAINDGRARSQLAPARRHTEMFGGLRLFHRAFPTECADSVIGDDEFAIEMGPPRRAGVVAPFAWSS